MILPFSTKINGQPNHFVEKIWEGLLRNVFENDDEYQKYLRLHRVRFGDYWDWLPDEHTRMTNPKIHTLREDKKDRWKAGNEIHFFINNQKPDMFQFAPVVPVVSTQKVEIVYYTDREVLVKDLPMKCKVILDDKRRLTDREIEILAMNDGFDDVGDFFDYFNQDFTGKIIHWTNFRY